MIFSMCTRPITIKNPDPHKFLGVTLQVPCGSCPECLKSRQDSWKLRLMEESNNWKYLYFFTLTYNDDSLPLTADGLSTASKRDVQLWLKRFRIAYFRSKLVPFHGKYFICAEYGPNGTHRPHYHGLLMTDESDVSSLFLDWSDHKGFVDFHSIYADQGERQAVANYVSKYCCKGEFASRRADIEAGLIEKAWTICSKGIGASYCTRMRSYHLPFRSKFLSTEDYLDCIIDRQYVSFSVKGTLFKYRMPRYYKERFYFAKMPFEVDIWDKKLKQYVKKIVYRFCTKNLLARQLQVRVRNRFLEEFHRQLQYAGFAGVEISDIPVEAFMALQDSSRYNMDMREDQVRRNLFSFYETNARKWSHL